VLQYIRKKWLFGTGKSYKSKLYILYFTSLLVLGIEKKYKVDSVVSKLGGKNLPLPTAFQGIFFRKVTGVKEVLHFAPLCKDFVYKVGDMIMYFCYLATCIYQIVTNESHFKLATDAG